MTEQDHPQGSEHRDDGDVEAVLRATLAGYGGPPTDLPDLERAVRRQLARRQTVRWQPLAAAIGVLVLVAGIVGAVRLSGSTRAAAPGPNAPVSSSASVMPSGSGSTPTDSATASTGPLLPDPDPELTLKAAPATKPYRTAPVPFAIYGPQETQAAPCTPATLSMDFVRMSTGPGTESPRVLLRAA